MNSILLNFVIEVDGSEQPYYLGGFGTSNLVMCMKDGARG
jgi:hypothetical protein